MGESGGAKVFGVVALKGGVGKTTVAANLGSTLSTVFGKKVLLVDANFSTPHLGIHVGLVNPDYTLHHVLNGHHSVYEAIYQHPLGFHVIPGKLAPELVDHGKLSEVLSPLRDLYEVIIIDSSPSLNEEMASAMAASDEILVVSSPDYPTLSSTLHAVKIAQDRGTPIKGIILNKVRRKRFELNPKDVASASQVTVLASIPDNVKVLSSLSRMTPIVNFSPGNEVSRYYKKLAGMLIGHKKSLKRLSLKKRKKKHHKGADNKKKKRSDSDAQEILDES